MGEPGQPHPPEESWVCPTDRHLALRAQLGTGWSVRTQKLGKYRRQEEGMTAEEQEHILQVIQRAKAIELNEQERVGRLVDRLENIRNRAQGDGDTTCVLCAETFGLITAATRNVCELCRKAVCSKCVVDTLNSQRQQQLFCKICSENRELWKRSGAWFFKGLPKYIVPVKAEKPVRRSPYVTRPNKPAPPPAPASSPQPVSYTTWSRGHPEESSSDSEDEVSLMRGRRQKRAQDSPADADNASMVSVSQYSVTSGSVMAAGQLSATESGRDDDDDLHSSYDDSSRKSSLWSQSETSFSRDGSVRSHTGSVTSRGHETESRERSYTAENLYEGDAYLDVPDSKTSGTLPLSRRTPSPISLPDDDFADNAILQEHPPSSPESDGGVLGCVEFSLLYDAPTCCLHCSILRARGLKAMDSNGLSDPYAKLHLLPGATKSTKLRTKTMHRTLNPEFNETLTYHGMTEDDLRRKTLRLTMLDEDRFGSDCIGEVRVPLRALQSGQEKTYSLYLEAALAVNQHSDVTGGTCICTSLQSTAEEEPSEVDRGKLLLSLCYNTKKQQLEIGVVRAAGLLPMDTNGYSDPFVKIYLKPDKDKKSKFKTKIVKKSLNPEFNERFVYSVSLSELAARTLDVTVWDKDWGKSNDYHGGIQLGVHAKGDSLRHWFDTLKNPDRTFERWHPLCGDPPIEHT